MVKLILRIFIIFIQISCFCSVFGQNVALYQQFNGRYDFTFIGNTMNKGENNITPGCESLLNTSSSATLSLSATQIIESAYLYWAGSGTGDFNVKLNNTDIVAQRTFYTVSLNQTLPYFSAFANVTNQVLATGNGSFTLSDLDISQTLLSQNGYCENRTNFAGWAMVIVYKDDSLPLNQINIYDGLQNIPNTLTISLNSLNVIDNNNAKIGFVAWEGDKTLAVNETLKINGNTLNSPPLNPANNAFNSTNSITGASNLYNMDLDIYNIQNNINIGDTSATIQLTSGQDFVMINVVVTKLNSQLPDATISIDTVSQACNSNQIIINYTIYNSNSTDSLPSNTPIAVYANEILVAQTVTNSIIPINASEYGQILISIPSSIPNDFIIKMVVDDHGFGGGEVPEISENNNEATLAVSQWLAPKVNLLEPLISCNKGLTKGQYDLSIYQSSVLTNTTDSVEGFYESFADATTKINPIVSITNYQAQATPKEIFIRVENENCFTITSFKLFTKNCPPIIYNYVSANDDNINDTFFIEGLRDIFLNFELEIYNRWGRLIWEGNNQTPDWNGEIIKGQTISNSLALKGTYYYILYLNDKDYSNPIIGWLYFTK